MEPLVSVIIPTIGRKSLREAIHSVFAQTYSHIEIIITDDTEEKKAFPMVEPYLKENKKIRYIQNLRYRHGPGGNKNNGLDHIQGKYFTVLDDDDTFLPTFIEELVQIAENSGYQIVFANCIDANTGELTGRHFGKSMEVEYVDMISGKFRGEYVGLVATQLLEEDRYCDECWVGEELLYLKLWKKAGKGFYYHKGLRLYQTDSIDSSLRLSHTQEPFRHFLVYQYLLQWYGEDYQKYCIGRYFHIYIMAVYFASISDKKKEILKLFRKAFQAHKGYTLCTSPWILFCFLFPKKIVSFVFLKWIKNSWVAKIIKSFLNR